MLDQTNFDYYVTLISTDGKSLYGKQTFDIENVVTAFYLGDSNTEGVSIQALLRKKNGVVTIHIPTENNDYYDFNSIIDDYVTQIL